MFGSRFPPGYTASVVTLWKRVSHRRRALLCRVPLWSVLGSSVPFSLFWPAVVVTAWYGGIGPGLLATLLSALAGGYFILKPQFSFAIEDPADRVGIVLFILTGALSSGIVGRARREIDARTSKLTSLNESLRQNEERLRFTLESTKVGQWELDVATGTTIRSLRQDQILGYAAPPTDWRYETFLTQHVFPDDRDRVDQLFKEVLHTNKELEFECRIVRTDQAVRWIWMKGGHYSTGESSSRLMLGLITDITERKQVEEDLRQANAKILRDSVLSKAVSEAQEKFISAENPLDSFNGFLTNLLSLTGSEYGFIDEMLYTADGAPYLIARAITNIAWSDDSRSSIRSSCRPTSISTSWSRYSGP